MDGAVREQSWGFGHAGEALTRRGADFRILPLSWTSETGPRIPGPPFSSFPSAFGALRTKANRSPRTAVSCEGFTATSSLAGVQARSVANAAAVCRTAISVPDSLVLVPGRIDPAGSPLRCHNQAGHAFGRGAPKPHRGQKARPRRREVPRPSRRQTGPANSSRPRRGISPPPEPVSGCGFFPDGHVESVR